ncbi:hypothetical protein [Photobacterium rosenbergii]|uniref:hypothetical protein n=1 Tax=Photobacterium rosenbergii TaxID=294936 RepID=UPI001C9933FF|nr:hypothetical protein [Photobacterium rosenbergii]MBY5947427.1 hypothetical protein [Photobacterium rosenbergii]
MKGHFIAKSNLSKSPGSVFPDANKSMQRLRYLFLHDLSVEQLTITLTLWLTSKLSKVNSENPVPEFVRLRASDPIRPNSYRIIKEGGDESWVEFSIQTQIQKKNVLFWQPAPRAFNQLFWQALRHKSYNKPIIPDKEKNQLSQFLTSSLTRFPEQQNIPIAHKTAWNNYITHCAHKDAQLNALAKASLITEKKLAYGSSCYYIATTTRHLRRDNYQAYNRYINRLLSAAKKEGISAFTNENDPYHDTDPLLNKNASEAGYLNREANTIPIVIIKNQVITEDEGVYVGTRRRVSTDQASRWLQTLNLELANIRPKSRKPVTTQLIAYHNLLTHIIAIHLITYCGCRPTHAISPAKGAIGLSSMCLRDKGKARIINFPRHIKVYIAHYRQHLQLIYSRFGVLHTENEPLLFLLNTSGKKEFLTAKSLRRFTAASSNAHVPYHFRKAYAQSLFEVGCPTHIFNRLMGHSQYGEQFGQLTQYAYDQQQDQVWTNRVAEYLGGPQETLC